MDSGWSSGSSLDWGSRSGLESEDSVRRVVALRLVLFLVDLERPVRLGQEVQKVKVRESESLSWDAGAGGERRVRAEVEGEEMGGVFRRQSGCPLCELREKERRRGRKWWVTDDAVWVSERAERADRDRAKQVIWWGGGENMEGGFSMA